MGVGDVLLVAHGARLVGQQHGDRAANLVGHAQARVVEDVVLGEVDQRPVIDRVLEQLQEEVIEGHVTLL
jgi:hypothetical protein